jgi:hypothetical protein
MIPMISRASHPRTIRAVAGAIARARPRPTRALGAQARSTLPPGKRAMKKLSLDLEAPSVETFATEPKLAQAEFIQQMISKHSCIEQCTTSCVP